MKPEGPWVAVASRRHALVISCMVLDMVDTCHPLVTPVMKINFCSTPAVQHLDLCLTAVDNGNEACFFAYTAKLCSVCLCCSGTQVCLYNTPGATCSTWHR